MTKKLRLKEKIFQLKQNGSNKINQRAEVYSISQVHIIAPYVPTTYPNTANNTPTVASDG